MTVAIGFYCHDGIVLGADSMLTPSMGGINVGHHKGEKVHLLAGNQLFAFAGDQGQAARFQIMAEELTRKYSFTVRDTAVWNLRRDRDDGIQDGLR